MLILAQAGCLALGLWLEDRFIRSASGPNAERPAAMRDLSDTAGNAPPVTAIRVMAFIWIAALQGVVAHLVLSRAQEETSRKQSRAESEVLQRDSELLRTRDAVIFGLAKLAESRDPDTGYHLERIALYSTRLAAALRRNPRFRRQITPQFVKLIGISASLHDIGKVGIADSILLNPAKFDDRQRQAMQHHAVIGGQCIRDIESRLGKSNFLQMAREIAFAHHERWDGTGYPSGLAGEEIPLAARIVAVADVYDALSTKRVYKDPLPHAQCAAMIKEGKGTHFDPAVIAAFCEIEAEFQEIAQRYAGTTEADFGASGWADDEALVASAAVRGIDDELAAAEALLAQCVGELPPPAAAHPNLAAVAVASGRTEFLENPKPDVNAVLQEHEAETDYA